MRSLQNIGENKGLNVLKAVVDANVWISALLTSGNARGIKEKLKEARFQLFFANELLEECLDVIADQNFSERSIMCGVNKGRLTKIMLGQQFEKQASYVSGVIDA